MVDLPVDPRRLAGWLVSVFAAGAGAVAGSYAVVGRTPAFVAAPIAAVTTELTPGALVTFAILVLGDLGEKLAFANGVLATVGLFGLVAGGAWWLAARQGQPAMGVPFAAAVAGLLAYALVGHEPSAAAAAVGTGATLTIPRLAAATGDDGTDPAGRRAALGALGTAAGAGLVGGVLGSRVETSSEDERADVQITSTPTPSTDSDGEDTNADGADDQATETAESTPRPGSPTALLNEAMSKSLDVAGLEPLVSEEFYTVDIASIDPKVSTEDWSLSVTGAVASEQQYDFDDLTAMERDHRFVTLRCVGEKLNGKKLDNALWTGVPLEPIVDAVDPQGEYVMLRADDDFYEEFPVEALREGFLAYGMNGEGLPRSHGAPVRALIPGHWGEINVKWLNEIEFLEREAKGYWEKRGWHGTGPVETVAKLWVDNRLDDGRMEVAGAAYAGTRGIQQVEVSTDGGDTWNEATLTDPLPGEDVWRQWVYRYDPPDGKHEVVVRATDGTGALQPKEESGAFPSGPTGWVSKTLQP